MVLVVSPTLQINSVQELVAYAKANPGKLNYGATVGTPPHMAWGLFTMLTGTDIVYVPYKGAAAAFTDLVAGQIQMNFDATGSLLPLIREGKLKALAVSSASRNPDLPEVPTMVESGIDFLMSFWTAVLAPRGNAARHRQQAQRHDQRRPGFGRDESDAGEISGGSKGRIGTGLRRVSRRGDEEMGGCREGSEYQGRMTMRPAKCAATAPRPGPIRSSGRNTFLVPRNPIEAVFALDETRFPYRELNERRLNGRPMGVRTR